MNPSSLFQWTYSRLALAILVPMISVLVVACGAPAATATPAPKPTVAAPAPTAAPAAAPTVAPTRPTAAPAAAPTATPRPPAVATPAPPAAKVPVQPPASVKATKHAQLGNILTDAAGKTVYLFTRDERNKSSCTGSCAATWPPLTTVAKAAAGAGAAADLLGSITREGGVTQVTYNGWPLHYFGADVKAGDANGQGTGNVWFVVSPDGGAVQSNAALNSTHHPVLGAILVDASGRTLYILLRDGKNKSTCTGSCARVWPPFLTRGEPKPGEGLTAGLVGTITRADDATQVTYNGRPLHYLSTDDKPGDITGQNRGDIWYVVSPAGEPNRVMFRMALPAAALGGSAQTGEVVLTSKGDKTEVAINIKSGAAGVAQPAHIHDKDCTTAGAVKFPLTNVTNGKSTTLVNASIDTLQAIQYAVRVHKSQPEIATYVACAEIPIKVVVPATSLGGSGQNGVAVLTAKGDKTEVVINITPGPTGVAQPAHIHDKDCTTAGAVKYPLKDVVDGRSSTVIDATLANLQKAPFVVRVHKSQPEIATYVACGEIPRATGGY